MVLVCESFFALDEISENGNAIVSTTPGEKEKEAAAFGMLELLCSVALNQEAELCCTVLGELLSMVLSTQCSLFLRMVSHWWGRRREKERTDVRLCWRLVRPSLVVKLSQESFLSLKNTAIPQLIYGTLVECLCSLSSGENVSNLYGSADVIQPLAPTIHNGLLLWCQVLRENERTLQYVASFLAILLSDNFSPVRVILGLSDEQRFLLSTAFLEVLFQWEGPITPSALSLMLTGRAALETITLSPSSDIQLSELRKSLVTIAAFNFERFPMHGEAKAQREAFGRALAQTGNGEWTALAQRIAHT